MVPIQSRLLYAFEQVLHLGGIFYTQTIFGEFFQTMRWIWVSDVTHNHCAVKWSPSSESELLHNLKVEFCVMEDEGLVSQRIPKLREIIKRQIPIPKIKPHLVREWEITNTPIR